MDIRWSKDNRPKLSKETATVNGRVFPLILVERGEDKDVPAFQQNRIVRALLDAASHGKKLDLNDIWGSAGQGAYCKDEMLEFYRLIGYTMSGYGEIFGHEKLNCTMWCDNCGGYERIHPHENCKKFVKGKTE